MRNRPYHQNSFSQVWELAKGTYIPAKYFAFLPEDNDKLRAFLSAFSGLIIGHNILDFDYQVLKSRIPIRRLYKKTVDTLAFLHWKRGNRATALVRRSLRRAKLAIIARSIRR